MILSNTVYDRKWFIWCTVGFVAMSVAMKLSGGVAFALIFPMVLAAFGKNRMELLLYCLLMTIAMTMGNPYLMPKGMSFGLMARAVHFLIAGVMVLQIVGQRNTRLTTPLLSLFAYLIYMAIVSSVGWSPLISYLKLSLFSVMFLGFYSVANAAVARQGVDARKIRSTVLAFTTFFIVGSVALIPFPGIATMSSAEFFLQHGYVPEGSLYMGITMHSQMLGPIIATMATLLLADLLFCVRRWDGLYLVLLFCTPILIYKTGSRTAMGTFMAGLCFVTFLLIQARGRAIGTRWKHRALSVLAIVGLLGAVAMFVMPGTREAVLKFVLKTRSDEAVERGVTWDAVTSSRQGAVEGQMISIQESPWIGNGFQVSRDMANREIVSWMQLLSAPIEKGVWVTAVLEEGGIFGMSLFVLFLLISIPTLIARRGYVGVCTLVVFVVANLGEFGFFSMTTWGGLVWALIFCGLTLDAHRQRETRIWTR